MLHDEAMIEYFGKHGCKQVIRRKPVRLGYTRWCQNTDLGFSVLLIYSNKEIEMKFGKCPLTVLHLLHPTVTRKKSCLIISFLITCLHHFTYYLNYKIKDTMVQIHCTQIVLRKIVH